MSRNAAVVRKRAVSNPGDTLRLSEPASSDLGVAGVSTSLSPQLRSPIQQAPTTPDDTSVAQGMNGSLRRRLGGSPAFPDYQTDGPAAPDKLEPAISRRERELSAPASAQVFTSASGFFGKGIRALGQGMGLTGPSAAGKEQVGPKRTWGDSISRAGKIDGMLMPPIKLGSEDNLGKLAGRSLGDADPEEEPTIRVVQSGNIMLEHATTQAREQRANATGDVLTDARAAVRTVWRKPVSTLSFDDPLSPRSGVESTPSTISSISKSTTGEHHDMSFSTRNATPSAARQTFEANRLARAATLAKSTAGAYTSPTRRGSVPPSGSAQSTSYNRRNSQPVVSTPSSSARSSTASPLTSQRRGSRFTEIWSPDQGNNAPLPPIPVEQPSHQYNAVRASQEPSATSLPTQGERMSKQLSAASGFSRDSSRLSAPISPHASVQFSAPGCTRTDSMLSAASAATTLSELGESLRWAHKFPEGRHMSRAMSRASMIGGRRISGLPPGSANASASTLPTLGYSAGGSVAASRASFGSRALAETRNGLRFLAKRRRDVDEDLDAHDALVERPDADQNEVPRPAKWNKFKWILFISVLVVSCSWMISVLQWADGICKWRNSSSYMDLQVL